MSLTLISRDGKSYKLPVDFANISETIKSIIDDSSIEEEIPLLNINSQTFDLIVEYAEHH